jgi:hypothetical protein
VVLQKQLTLPAMQKPGPVQGAPAIIAPIGQA